MLYDIQDGKWKCRTCPYTEDLTQANPIVYEHVLKKDVSDTLVQNVYLKHDPTLEHLTSVVCPNADCPTHSAKIPNDVVPIEIDATHLLWLYQCVVCDHTWKQSGRAV